jgi:predicted dehydrogenase
MSRFKIVLAGCGSMANTWVSYALERADCEIVALVDINAANATALEDRHGLSCPIFSDITEAIRSSGANLVFDVTIPEAHEAIVTAAVTAGCDVFGEKPLAASMAAATRMVGAARDAGKIFAVMQNRRYLKTTRAMRDLVQSGAIGTLGMLNADFFIGAHFGGFRDAMDSPLLLDMAIHTFDGARFMGGADPVSVYCHEFNPAGSWYAGNAAAICIFEMSDGSVFSYRGSWCAEGAATTWEADWRATGSKGTAIWRGEEAPYAEVVRDPQQTGFTRDTKRLGAELNWAGREGHAGCLDEMFAALIAGTEPQTICTDNIKSLAMVFGALESARTGTKISLELNV